MFYFSLISSQRKYGLVAKVIALVLIVVLQTQGYLGV